MAGESKGTTDHETIQRWVDERGGRPASVRGTAGDDDAGVLRIDFPGYSGEESLEPISWEEFFEKFEEKKLAFLYQDETRSGAESRFSKLVSRDTAKGMGAVEQTQSAQESEERPQGQARGPEEQPRAMARPDGQPRQRQPVGALEPWGQAVQPQIGQAVQRVLEDLRPQIAEAVRQQIGAVLEPDSQQVQGRSQTVGQAEQQRPPQPGGPSRLERETPQPPLQGTVHRIATALRAVVEQLADTLRGWLQTVRSWLQAIGSWLIRSLVGVTLSGLRRDQ